MSQCPQANLGASSLRALKLAKSRLFFTWRKIPRKPGKIWFSQKKNKASPKIHLVTSQCCNPFLDKATWGRSVQIIGTSLHETWTVFPSLVLVRRSYEKGKTAASPTYKNNEDVPLGGQIQKQEGASNWILPNLYIYKWKQRNAPNERLSLAHCNSSPNQGRSATGL